MTQDSQIRDAIYTAVTPDIERTARLLAKRYFGIPYEDLLAECNFAFIQALNDFNVQLSDDFVGYMVSRCYSRAMHYMRDKVRLIRIPLLKQGKGADYDSFPRAFLEADIGPFVTLTDDQRDSQRKHKPSLMDKLAIEEWNTRPDSIGDTVTWQLVLQAIHVCQNGGSARKIANTLGIRRGSGVANAIKRAIQRYINNEDEYGEMVHDVGCWPLCQPAPGSDLVPDLRT